jgi:hypothetical protein
MGIGHVTQGKINRSETAGYRHGSYRPLGGQFFHSVIITTRKYDTYRSHI